MTGKKTAAGKGVSRKGGARGTEKQVRVSIRSQTIDLLDGHGPSSEKPEVIEYSTDGRLALDGDTVRITYDEPSALGMDESTTSLFFDRTRPGLINMSRSGGTTAGLTFDPVVRRQNCALNSAGLGIEFCVFTRKVENKVTPEDGGRIELDYLIEFRGIKTERNLFSIDVRTDAGRGLTT